ncbi:unnamed protein product [Blepharisma stoltei]|uniref:Uncharacterized protein n=1 Tax=Blepharisma stoltei TaxID=1481888 RepID=A0AAU9K0E2_9CILI|nr:unnamed protein product [Blepharisma stoltei]
MESSPDRYQIEDKVSSIRKAISELSPSGQEFGFESSFRPSLFNRIDSASSFNTERSLDRFLEERFEEDSHRVDVRSSLAPVEEKSLDYSREERPLIRSPAAFNRNHENMTKSFEELRQGSPSFKSSFKTNEYHGFTSKKDDSWENSILLEMEKENSIKLEGKVIEKDRIIDELTQKNSRLQREVDEYRTKMNLIRNEKESDAGYQIKKIDDLQARLEACEIKNMRLQEQSSNFQVQMNVKDQQIKRLEFEKNQIERNDDQKIQRLEEAERKINGLVKERANLINENENLRFQLESNEKQTITSKSIVLDLQREVSRLSAVRDAREEEIKGLRSELDRAAILRKEDAQRLEEEVRSVLKKKRDLESEISDWVKKGISNLKAALGNQKPENAAQILTIIRELKEYKNHKKLIQRLSKLIKECSPPGTFYIEPNSKQIWKWVRRLMEDYLVLKKRASSAWQ